MKKTIRLTESDLIKVIKRIIKEQTEESICTKEKLIGLEREFSTTLASAGIRLTPEENDTVQPGCPIESDIPSNINDEQKNLISQILSKMKKMGKEDLKSALKQLVSVKNELEKNPPTQNQSIAEGLNPTLTIIGVGAAAWLLAGPVIAFLVVAAIVLLAKVIFRGSCFERGGRKGSSCRRRYGLGGRH